MPSRLVLFGDKRKKVESGPLPQLNGSVADGRIDEDDDPAAAAMSADDAASSMLENGKRNKNETKDIGIQEFYAVLQLGEGYLLIALLLSCNEWGPSYMPHSPSS